MAYWLTLSVVLRYAHMHINKYSGPFMEGVSTPTAVLGQEPRETRQLAPLYDV